VDNFLEFFWSQPSVNGKNYNSSFLVQVAEEKLPGNFLIDLFSCLLQIFIFCFFRGICLGDFSLRFSGILMLLLFGGEVGVF
jgi:hypothetical protein